MGDAWSAYHTSVNTAFCPHRCKQAQQLCFTTVRRDYTTKVKAKRGPHAGYACIFPFNYKGKAYTGCTSVDWPVPWCAVVTMGGANVAWGDCPRHSNCSACAG